MYGIALGGPPFVPGRLIQGFNHIRLIEQGSRANLLAFMCSRPLIFPSRFEPFKMKYFGPDCYLVPSVGLLHVALKLERRAFYADDLRLNGICNTAIQRCALGCPIPITTLVHTGISI